MATAIQPFESLKTSTATVMVYSNLSFDLMNLFKHTRVTTIDPPLTKKKRNIDKKHLTAPYGAIISLQYNVYIRGIRMSKEKRYWCPSCQLMKTGSEAGSEKQILTVREILTKIPKAECNEIGLPFGTQKIKFICSECRREFEIRQLRKIVPFLNQVTIVLSIGHVIVNIMMFKDNLKIAGNRSYEDAISVVMILWEEYIGLASSSHRSWSFREDQTDVHFLFDLVMRNVDFRLDFPIDKRKLNQLMNCDEYKDHVHLSKCETTSDTHVNIKMFTKKPSNFKYDMLVYEEGGVSDGTILQVEEKLYSRKKRPEAKYITFIVFSSAETILTGRYNESMKEEYEFFVEIVNKHRKEIEEVINKPKMSIQEYLEIQKES